MDMPLRVLIIGAHPDDADINCGGLALKYSSQGHIVKFLSCTNGATGHYNIGGIELARRRYQEAQESAKVANLSEYQILDWHTGELEPTVVNRKVIIKIIRDFKPDLIITHRHNDYHPDHRYTSQLVQDASYIITVPNMVPLTDIVTKTPVICYMQDEFQKPYPFLPDVVVSIDDVIDEKMSMLHCHVSQMYEWLPYNNGILDQVPADDGDRRKWLEKQYDPVWKDVADLYRERLVELYGQERGRAIKYAEAYEICEYGAALPSEDVSRLFPFD